MEVFNLTINIWEERIVKDDGSKEPKKAFIYFQEYLNLGVDAAAKLIKRESAVELDTSNGKFTNLSNKEVGDLFRSAMMNGGEDFF